jgi:hypothetical protein
MYHIRVGKCGYLPSVKGCFHYKGCTLLYIYIYTHTHTQTHIKTVVTGEKDNNLYTRIHVKLFNVLMMEIENFMKNNVGIIKEYDKFHFVDPIRHYPCPNTPYD